MYLCAQVSWVPGARRGEFTVLSAGSGGRVLLWTVDGAEAKLILSSGYALVQQQVPQSGAASKVGVTIWSCQKNYLVKIAVCAVFFVKMITLMNRMVFTQINVIQFRNDI